MRLVTTVSGCSVLCAEDGIYVVRLAGNLTLATSTEITASIRRDRGAKPFAVVYETTAEFQGYDPALRTHYLGDSSVIQGVAHIAIVTPNGIFRMVAATVALGLRALKGTSMAAYNSVESAVAGSRLALARASK
jgi:hypothetical protein